MNIEELPGDVQKAIMKAFNATGKMDLYEGDTLAYLDIITQTLREQRGWIEHARTVIQGLLSDMRGARR
jgi:hypothetical protein